MVGVEGDEGKRNAQGFWDLHLYLNLTLKQGCLQV